MSALDGSSPITAQPNDIIAAIMEYCWPLDWISARRICRRWKIIVDASIEKWSAAAGAYLFDQMTKYENCQAKIYRRWVDNAMCLYHPAVIKYHKVVPSPVEIKFVSLLNTPIENVFRPMICRYFDANFPQTANRLSEDIIGELNKMWCNLLEYRDDMALIFLDELAARTNSYKFDVTSRGWWQYDMKEILDLNNPDRDYNLHLPIYLIVGEIHDGRQIDDMWCEEFPRRIALFVILDIIMDSLDTRSSACLLIGNMAAEPVLRQIVVVIMTLAGFGYNRAMQGRADGQQGMEELWPFRPHDVKLNTQYADRLEAIEFRYRASAELIRRRVAIVRDLCNGIKPLV